MSEEVLATIEGSAQDVRRMIEATALAGRGDPYHDDIYVNIGDGELRTIVGSPGNVVVAFCSFNENFVETIEGDVEAIIDVGDFLSYLDIATDGGRVELEWLGDEDDRLATRLRMEGKLQSTIMLPASEAVLEEVPLGLPQSFDEENQMHNSEGDTLGTEIGTSVQELQTIVDAVDLREDIDFYPVVVDDGAFKLDVGDERDQEIRGVLTAEVEGVDVDNRYNEGFTELVDTLSGGVDLATDEDAPLAAVKESDGAVLRHVIGNVG